jgi:hypothetical protein
VSMITNNWRTRMVPPPLGDYRDIPLTDAGKKIADAWDPAKDEAAHTECKYYGAASIMFQPARLHIAWQDDNTLRMDVDAGTQTRLFRFGTGATPAAKRTWQGNSMALWEARGAGPRAAQSPGRYLKVTTTNMLPGFLRKNGVPYGERAVLTEYYDLFKERDGTTMSSPTSSRIRCFSTANTSWWRTSRNSQTHPGGIPRRARRGGEPGMDAGMKEAGPCGA